MKAFVLFRDRVSYGQQCVAALQKAGLDVHVIDHESSWPLAVDWVQSLDAPVHYRPNRHPRYLWKERDWLHHMVGSSPYLVTDPDVVPDNGCPQEWTNRLLELLQCYPDRVKVGLGLRIDDIPTYYPHREAVQEWEDRYWTTEMEPGVFDADVDTTLAIYQPLDIFSHFELGPALRTGDPYVARHLAWYEVGEPSDELAYYRAHATPNVSHWMDPETYLNTAE